jgi:DNA-binding response OmpR family regulator
MRHAASRIGGRALPGERVLLVEDDPLIREIMSEALEEAGFAVTAAETGDIAATLLAHEPFGLLLTDIQMPGHLDGVALALHARELAPDMPVIYVTGRPDALRGLSRLGPRDAFIRKPYGPGELIGTVRRLLAAGPG